MEGKQWSMGISIKIVSLQNSSEMFLKNLFT